MPTSVATNDPSNLNFPNQEVPGTRVLTSGIIQETVNSAVQNTSTSIVSCQNLTKPTQGPQVFAEIDHSIEQPNNQVKTLA